MPVARRSAASTPHAAPSAPLAATVRPGCAADPSPETVRATVRVLKFGGTSLRDASRMRAAADIVAEAARETTPIVVVSAIDGATDELAEIVRLAAGTETGLASRLKAFRERHFGLLHELGGADPDDAPGFGAQLDELERLVEGVRLLRDCSPRAEDRILGFGELLSARLLATALRGEGLAAGPVDARPLVRTDDRFGAARVRVEESFDRIRRALPGTNGISVVTGFVASGPRDEPTTLGRGGSDYTATLIGAALAADFVEIWTDVSGILTADPRLVPDARPVAEMSYDELLELAGFGAKVIYPRAVRPARDRGIPLVIRNSLDPSAPGTVIVAKPRERSAGPARGVSAVRGAALLRMEGFERIGILEGVERSFRALRAADVEPLLFTQDASGHRISIALPEAQLEAVLASLGAEFERERSFGLLDAPDVERDRSVLALVGDGMRHAPGVAGRLFGTLGKAGINVHAIAQGSSERNISLVVAAEDEVAALRGVHDAFFGATSPGRASPRRNGTHPSLDDVRICVIGAGRVGSELLDQLVGSGLRALRRRGVRGVLGAVVTSRRATAAGPETGDGIDAARWRALLADGNDDPEETLDRGISGGLPTIVVDCTASAAVAGRHQAWLRSGAAVVTANKLALGGPLRAYTRLLRLGGPTRRLRYETTVGAGLPVLRTVAEMRATGDRIVEIEAVLSGTLAFLFTAVADGIPFGAALAEARTRGLTEPDPREDLRLGDVVRKLVILAREAGHPLDADEVSVEPLLPARFLAGADIEAFERALPEADSWVAAEFTRARENGAALLLPVARLGPQGATVRLEEIPPGAPLAGLSGTDNIVSIRSRRYDERSLVVRGPGAGPAVTAAGLLAEILEVAGPLATTTGVVPGP